jgi:RimJ/RimL family protein N-acetyltransferase
VQRERKTRSGQASLTPHVLAGRAALLRPLRASDHATSVRWRNDAKIRDNILGYRFPITEEMEAHWVDAVLNDQSRTRVVLAIEDKEDGVFVGFVYLNNIDWFARNAEFGILIGERSRQGRGLAKDALALVAGYAFTTLNLNRLYLRVVSFNKRALRLYRSFGFVVEGVQRKHAFVRGRYYDVALMGLLRREFEGRFPPSGRRRPS